MSGEVNMIQIQGGGPDQANLGGASLETFSGEAQLKKPPCSLPLSVVPDPKASRSYPKLLWPKTCSMFIDVKPLLNHIDDGEQGQPARGVVGTSGHPGVVAFDVGKWLVAVQTPQLHTSVAST